MVWRHFQILCLNPLVSWKLHFSAARPQHAPDWSHPDTGPIRLASVAIAHLAERLAKQIGGCDPACAWAGGLLGPLGWHAVCAVDPDAAGDCSRAAERGSETQRQLWRFDAQEIGRRLARRWKLPGWLRAIVGYLGGPVHLAVEVGADQRLFQIVQLAVLLAQANGHNFGLTVGAECEELIQALSLTAESVCQVGAVWRSDCSNVGPLPPTENGESLLPALLEVAIDKRRLDDGPFAERLETEVDRLQQTLAEQRAVEAKRLHTLKLRAGGTGRGSGARDQQPTRRHFRPQSISAGQRRRCEPARLIAGHRPADGAHSSDPERTHAVCPPATSAPAAAGCARAVSRSRGDLPGQRRRARFGAKFSPRLPRDWSTPTRRCCAPLSVAWCAMPSKPRRPTAGCACISRMRTKAGTSRWKTAGPGRYRDNANTCSTRSIRAARPAGAAGWACPQPGALPANTTAKCALNRGPTVRRTSCWSCRVCRHGRIRRKRAPMTRERLSA